MNKTIIKNFNEIVKEDDMVYHIGDWCFKNSPGGKSGEGVPRKAYWYLKQLNGIWILLKGNHDRNNSLKTKLISGAVEFGRQKFWLVHNPKDANPNFAINLVGHVHEAFKFKPVTISGKTILLVNVGVDVWDFRPVSFETIITESQRYIKENKLNIKF